MTAGLLTKISVFVGITKNKDFYSYKNLNFDPSKQSMGVATNWVNPFITRFKIPTTTTSTTTTTTTTRRTPKPRTSRPYKKWTFANQEYDYIN